MDIEMQRQFIIRRSKDIDDCVAKLKNLDWNYFERLGHQLKGTAASYGYDDLGDIANQIEISALHKDLMTLEVHVQAFSYWYEVNSQLDH